MAEKTKRQLRVERRLKRRKDRRALITMEVRGNDGAYRTMSGMRRGTYRMLAEQHEIQIARIEKKRETRKRLAAMKPKERAAARKAGERQFHKVDLTA